MHLCSYFLSTSVFLVKNTIGSITKKVYPKIAHHIRSSKYIFHKKKNTFQSILSHVSFSRLFQLTFSSALGLQFLQSLIREREYCLICLSELLTRRHCRVTKVKVPHTHSRSALHSQDIQFMDSARHTYK